MSKKLRKTKGYDIWALVGISVAFVVITIVISFGAQILSQIQTSQTSNTYAYNITGFGLTSLNTFGTWLPTLALVVIASVIIGIIIGYLVVRLFRQDVGGGM